MKAIPITQRELNNRLVQLAKEVLAAEGKIPFTTELINNKVAELKKQGSFLLDIAENGFELKEGN